MVRARSGRDIDSALCKRGFIRDSGGDHIRYTLRHPTLEGLVIRTKMSHGMSGSAIDANMISKMSRQLHLTKSQFLELIDCTLDETAYRNILREQGFAV